MRHSNDLNSIKCFSKDYMVWVAPQYETLSPMDGLRPCRWVFDKQHECSFDLGFECVGDRWIPFVVPFEASYEFRLGTRVPPKLIKLHVECSEFSLSLHSTERVPLRLDRFPRGAAEFRSPTRHLNRSLILVQGFPAGRRQWMPVVPPGASVPVQEFDSVLSCGNSTRSRRTCQTAFFPFVARAMFLVSGRVGRDNDQPCRVRGRGACWGLASLRL